MKKFKKESVFLSLTLLLLYSIKYHMISYKIRQYQESDAKHVALLSKELGYLATSSDVERRFAILLKYTAIHGIFVAQL